MTLLERIAGAADATRAAQRAYFRDRTPALGDGWVPAQAAAAWRILGGPVT